MPQLYEWSVTTDDSNPYLAPELRVPMLLGKVMGHVDFTDGTQIRTSKVLKLDIKRGVAITKNSLYTLGYPSSDWLKWLDENNFKLKNYSFDNTK